MKEKRIILVFPDPPLPFGTAAARAYYVTLKGLHERGHHVTAFAACAHKRDQEEVAKLFPANAYDLRCFPYAESRGIRSKWQTLRSPFSYPFGPALREDLTKTLAEGFDVLQLETHWGGCLGKDYVQKTLVNVHNLYCVDLPRHPLGLPERLLRQRVIACERTLLASFPRISTLSESLAAHIRMINPKAQVHVAPLGFDAGLYPFKDTQSSCTAPTLGLIGSFNWHPTYTAGVRLLSKLWPRIRARVPEVRLLLVGRHARRALAPYLPEDTSKITIEEDVADTLPFFRQLDVMLYAPEVGTGMKVKILEAFALGIAVATNKDGVEGLPARDGVHAGVAETDDLLVDRAVTLLTEPAVRRPQTRAARELVESVCNPMQWILGLEDIYEQIN